MHLNKDEMRREAMRHRERIDPVTEDPDEACEIFFLNIKPQPAQSVGLYVPMGRELDVLPLLEKLLEKGHVCALPVIQKDSRELKFARWQEDEPLEEGPYKVMQPQITDKTEWVEPDIVVVPLLAFDRRGYRLGYGGGYYDATLAALRAKKDILAVGWAYAQQAVLFNLPKEDHDEQLDWVITPQNAQRFKPLLFK